MKFFLMAQDPEIWESVVTGSTMEEESNEYNARAIKTFLSSLLDPIKVKMKKYSSTEGLWENLQDLHSKGLLLMTSNIEDGGKERKDNQESKEVDKDTKSKEDLEDEENEEDPKKDLKAKLEVALEEISVLKRENEELKKQVQDVDLDKTKEEVDLFKLQVQERDKELNKFKEELHQNKKRHHEEIISMTT